MCIVIASRSGKEPYHHSSSVDIPLKNPRPDTFKRTTKARVSLGKFDYVLSLFLPGYVSHIVVESAFVYLLHFAVS